MKRKIAAFTGSRAEYGILKSVLEKIHESQKLHLQLVVGGTHFLKGYGETINNIKTDGFHITKTVEFATESEVTGKMPKEVGKAIVKLTNSFLELDPDIILINGDRSETFAAAIAGALIPKVVAHLHGGEISAAGLDETMRHAITKLSHIHFVSSEDSKRRVVQMGEDPKRVFRVGAPGLDGFISERRMTKKEIAKSLGISIGGQLMIVLLHPLTTSIKSSQMEMKVTLEAIGRFSGTKIIIYPNADPGSKNMVLEIEKYRTSKGYYIFPNINRDLYINLLRNADLLIGNSSGGIIETASIPLPTVNIGSRQKGRERNANVIDVGYNEREIEKAIKKAISFQFRNKLLNLKNVYGDGNSAPKIVKILETIQIKNITQKYFYERQN